VPDHKHSRIALIILLMPPEGQIDEQITARYTRNLRGKPRATKKACGLMICFRYNWQARAKS
jgi:hypothetical protein